MERTSRDSKMKEEEDVQAGVEIWKYVLGFSGIAVVKCAIELGIAEAIENHEGTPMALSELSSTLGCVPFSLDRIMRFLVHHHFFKEEPTIQGTAGYVHTPLSRRLLRQGEDSMADFILLESSPVMLAPWHHLSSRVRINGTAAFEAAYGGDIWKYAAANPAFNRLINDAMACDARLAVSAIIESCPKLFDGLKTLVDVGGGNGTALGKFVKAFPWIEGINFDLPHVVSVAAECEGVKQVGGDMFDSVPKADAVFIMKVLQDWNNDDCVRILKKCKEAIPKDKGKVIIVETVIGEEKQDSFEFVRFMKDMAMMAFTNSGKERTSEEWDCVLKEAGFSSYNIIPIRAVQSVIEAFP